MIFIELDLEKPYGSGSVALAPNNQKPFLNT